MGRHPEVRVPPHRGFCHRIVVPVTDGRDRGPGTTLWSAADRGRRSGQPPTGADALVNLRLQPPAGPTLWSGERLARQLDLRAQLDELLHEVLVAAVDEVD